MKKLPLLFSLVTCSVFAQIPEDELHTVWDRCIVPIANLEKDRIIDITQFPLEGEWAIVVGIEQEPTLIQYKNHLEDIFTEDMRNEMLGNDFTSFITEELEDGSYVVSYAFMEIFVEDDTEYESMTYLTFEKIDGKWKLVAITYAG